MSFRAIFPRILTLIFAAGLFLSFYMDNNLKDFGLKGKVRRVVCNDYNGMLTPEGKVKAGAWIDSVVCEFNANGKLTSSYTYRGHKKPAIRERFEYNSEGNPVFHIKVSLNTTIDSSFFYYQNGLHLETISFASVGGVISGPMKTNYVYQVDKIIRETTLDKSGDSLSDLKYSYNEKGKIGIKRETEYGKANRIELQFTETYLYDASGNIIAAEFVDLAGQSTKTTTTFNVQGDKLFHGVESAYFTLQHSFTYEYDSHENWINCVKYLIDPRPQNAKVAPPSIQTFSVRKIEYF